ncbi:hypothetical protein [Rhizobium halophytocola]|uniref:Transmembrane protein PGPGW n=1 Tax=Rhizobium halophytocola TaxID=735519 RepID=A0ABS4DVY2_9HYPH|nr:hypothetical protein [Rhizobium halophytocola]MBP1849835.1 hypothetical protein [Rhizobium halophytocola]
MAKASRFRVDTENGRLVVGRFHLPIPRSRTGRILIGLLLVLGGCLGFLPILGFWMIPLGLLLLSQDLAPVRRLRRRMALWWGRRRGSNRPAAGN